MILHELIAAAFDNRALLQDHEHREAVCAVIDQLDKGVLRVAEPILSDDGTPLRWQINEWVKKAILLYFGICDMQPVELGPFEYHDKIRLKQGYPALGVRVVPPATARYGAFLAPGTVLMPSYVNIGAYVDSGTMVDTWATVGSCAQIGKSVHLSGGVGIGGVLEPLQAAPVIIEDHCFTGSTKIIDVTQSEPVHYQGYVPPRSVVIPGSYTKHFAAGDYQVPCALIIGQRKESTDKKTSLNSALRDFGIS